MKFESIQHVYQSLTDLEIEDDSKRSGVPQSRIRVRGVGDLLITQCSEWDFYNVLVPLRERIVNHLAGKMINAGTVDMNRLSEKIKMFASDLSLATEDDEAAQKISGTMTTLFDDEQVRRMFFIALRKLGVCPWYTTWRRWQRSVRPTDSATVFILLWAFNFDGVKKNCKKLLETIRSISSDTSGASRTGSNSSGSMEQFIAMHKAAKERELSSSSKS